MGSNQDNAREIPNLQRTVEELEGLDEQLQQLGVDLARTCASFSDVWNSINTTATEFGSPQNLLTQGAQMQAALSRQEEEVTTIVEGLRKSCESSIRAPGLEPNVHTARTDNAQTVRLWLPLRNSRAYQKTSELVNDLVLVCILLLHQSHFLY